MNVASLVLPSSTAAEPYTVAGRQLPRPLQVALLLSAVLHAVALGWLPGFDRLAERASLPLRILLPPPEPLSPPAAVSPAPTPTPVPRGAVASPPPALASAAATVPAFVLDAPTQHREEVALAAMPMPPPAAFVAEPAAPPLNVDGVDAQVLAGYGRSVAGALAMHQRYPRLAQLRQWQGTTLLRLEFAADGRMLDTRVLSSSGHEVLDRQALEMLRAALPLPPLPAVLAGRNLVVNVPVVFRLGS